jgi:hypothetical protein
MKGRDSDAEFECLIPGKAKEKNETDLA